MPCDLPHGVDPAGDPQTHGRPPRGRQRADQAAADHCLTQREATVVGRHHAVHEHCQACPAQGPLTSRGEHVIGEDAAGEPDGVHAIPVADEQDRVGEGLSQRQVECAGGPRRIEAGRPIGHRLGDPARRVEDHVAPRVRVHHGAVRARRGPPTGRLLRGGRRQGLQLDRGLRLVLDLVSDVEQRRDRVEEPTHACRGRAVRTRGEHPRERRTLGRRAGCGTRGALPTEPCRVQVRGGRARGVPDRGIPTR